MSHNNYQIGDVVRGTVTGIQSYGAFVQLDEENQGLIHISELKHGYVSNIEKILSINDILDVMVIDVDEFSKKISLSLRTLEASNYPPFPAKIKHKRKRRYPNIGFSTLKQALPGMIQQGLANIEYDEDHIRT